MNSNYKAKQAYIKAREKEILDMIKETKERLSSSVVQRDDTSSQLTALSPNYSEAAKLLKNKYIELKQSIEAGQRVNKIMKNKGFDKKSSIRSISRDTLIYINKEESDMLLHKQYRNKVKAFKNRNQSGIVHRDNELNKE